MIKTNNNFDLYINLTINITINITIIFPTKNMKMNNVLPLCLIVQYFCQSIKIIYL